MLFKKKIVNKIALRTNRLIKRISELTFKLMGLDRILAPLQTLMEISHRLEGIIKAVSEKLIPIKL